jgi:hypothetical protein
MTPVAAPAIGGRRRPIPIDFAETAAAYPKYKLLGIYNVGPTTLARWFAEAGGKGPPPHDPYRKAPADFAEHAHETNIELARRYRAGASVLKRWRSELGVVVRDPHAQAPIPDGFGLVAPTMTRSQLSNHYQRSDPVIRRWLSECGARARKAAPESQARSIPTIGGRKHGKIDRPHLNTTRAGQAADFLRQFGPVIRCNAAGQYHQHGDHWRRGSTILCADEVIARAQRLGFNPDGWREVRAA